MFPKLVLGNFYKILYPLYPTIKSLVLMSNFQALIGPNWRGPFLNFSDQFNSLFDEKYFKLSCPV